MTRGCRELMKTVSTASSNLAEQKMFSKKQTKESKKTTANEDPRSSSQKFLQKFRKLTTKSTSTKSEASETDDTLNSPSIDVFVTQASTSESSEEPKLKGILRNSNPNLTRCTSIDEVHNRTQSVGSHPADNTNIGHGDHKIHASLTSLGSNKRVTFSDKVSKKTYKANKTVYDVLKIPTRQQKKLEKLKCKEFFDLPRRKSARANSVNASFEHGHYSDSSEDDLNDNDS